jgi:hypothetical protein
MTKINGQKNKQPSRPIIDNCVIARKMTNNGQISSKNPV